MFATGQASFSDLEWSVDGWNWGVEIMKYVYGSLLGLLVCGLSPAQRELFSPFYSGPVTNPLQGPFINPYNPYSFYNPYTYYGNPGARPYGAVPGTGFGTPGSAVPGYGQGVIVQNLGDPSMTGHPTRFFDYSRYFFNQGGTVLGSEVPNLGTTVPGQTGQTPAAGAIGTARCGARRHTPGPAVPDHRLVARGRRRA